MLERASSIYRAQFISLGQAHFQSPNNSFHALLIFPPGSRFYQWRQQQKGEDYENNSYRDSFRIDLERNPVNAADLTRPGCRSAGTVRKSPKLRSHLYEVGNRPNASNKPTFSAGRSRPDDSSHEWLYRGRCAWRFYR